jgi:DNA-nicking Smr family endonuclease
MKKQKKADNIPGKFAAKPFSSLKGFQSETAKPPGKTALPKPPPAAPPEVDDDILFLRAMAEVRRLQTASPAGKSAPKPAPAGRAVAEEERRVFLQAVERLHLDVTFRDELPEGVTPLHPAGSNRLRQLRRGALRIDLELDLHGLTREEALASLERFVAGAYNRGQKAVLVITGKGNNSPEEPVLRGAVAGWLRDRGKGMVAEFSPAPRQMGGSGAFVVFLKEKVRPETSDQ